MTAPEIREASRQTKDAEATHGTILDQKDAEYDVEIKKVSDYETDHQVHLGVDLQPTLTEQAEDRKLLRKIDLHIMPLLMFTYGLQVSSVLTPGDWITI